MMSRSTPRRRLIKDAVVPTSSPTSSADGNSAQPIPFGQLRTDALAPTSGQPSSPSPNDGNSTTSSSSSQQPLVLLGYDENASPIYKKPCLSNDNDEPYKDNCTISHIFGSSESYTYECTTDQYCNSHPPGNTHDLGWTFVGACDAILTCPEPYDEAKAGEGGYVLGDQTMVSSDHINGNEIGSISCPGESSNQQNNTESDISQEEIVALVPYFYEVETSQVSTANDFLPRLEERILLNLADSMMKCTSRRKLPGGTWMRSMMQRFMNADRAQFNVRGIESHPDDVVFAEGSCAISSDGADNCFIINGSLTLILDPMDINAYNITTSIMNATDTAQANLQNAMDNDDLLSPFLPEVVKVRYLGDSYMEDEILADVSGETKDERARAWLWGPPIVAAFLALLALLIVRKNGKKSKTSQRSSTEGVHDSQDEGGDFDWEEWGLDFDDPKLAGFGFGSGTNGKVILYAGNLSKNTTKEEVRALFEDHGTVLCCILPSRGGIRRGIDPPPRANDTGRFALVTMPAMSDLEKAEADNARITVNGVELDGYALRVREVTTLYVGNLSPMTTEQGLRGLFEQYGVIIGCVILPNHQGRGRYGLVSMPGDDARSAIANLHGLKVDGNILSVRDIMRRSNMRNLMDDSFSTCNNERDEKNSAGKLAILGTTGAVMGGKLLKKKRKKRTGSTDKNDPDAEHNLDNDLEDIINNIDGSTEGQDRRIFVVDPPGAFHLGKHHYTGDGVRYFSPLCQQCIAARADANGVVTLNAINADDDSNPDLSDTNDLSFDLEAATKFTDFNCNDLGRCHSSIHVRQCKSTTCTGCKNGKEVYFVNSYL